MKKLAVSLFAAALSSQVSAAAVQGTIGFTSDYRYAGVSQTAGDPAIQGSLDVSFDNGVYAGLWGSNLNFGDDANLELDYYVGYYGVINDSLSYAVDVAYFQSPGYSYDGDYLYYEMFGYYKNLTVGFTFTDNYFNSDMAHNYLAFDYAQPLPKDLSLNLHVGRSMAEYWEESSYGEYNDYSIGVSGNLSGLDIAIDYIANDADVTVDTGLFRNDDNFVLTISRTF